MMSRFFVPAVFIILLLASVSFTFSIGAGQQGNVDSPISDSVRIARKILDSTTVADSIQVAVYRSILGTNPPRTKVSNPRGNGEETREERARDSVHAVTQMRAMYRADSTHLADSIACTERQLKRKRKQ